MKLLIFLATDIYIQKLAPNGNFIWCKQIGGAYYDKAFSIELTSDNDIYISGLYLDEVDFDPGPETYYMTAPFDGALAREGFILKLDENGDFIWVKSFGGDRNIDYTYMVLDDENNIYLSGVFEDEMDANPSEFVMNISALNSHAFFLEKLDEDGNLIWVKKMDMEASLETNYWLRDLDISPTGNVFILGHLRAPFDANPADSTILVDTNGDYDIFLEEFDTEGDFVSIKTIGGTSFDRAMQFSFFEDGGLVIGGKFGGIIDFDPGEDEFLVEGEGMDDAFILKLDAEGNFSWVKTFGGEDNDEVRGVSVNSEGEIWCTGNYIGTVNFDPEATGFSQDNLGGSTTDAFYLRLNALGELMTGGSYGGVDNENVYHLNLDQDDNVYMYGSFFTNADFNPSSSEAFVMETDGLFNGFLLKLGTLELADLSGVELTSDIELFPNPATNTLYLNLANLSGSTQIEIYDLNGKLITRHSFNEQKLVELNVDNLDTGMYLIKILNSGQFENLRFIKE